MQSGIKFLLFFFSLITILFFISSAYAGGKDYISNTNPVSTIPGEVLRACIATYLLSSNSTGESSEAGPNSIPMSDLADYDVLVYDDGDTYRVSYFFKVSKFPNHKGGGLEYVVNKKTFVVLQRQGYK